MANIKFTQGYKDAYRVVVEPEREEWAPTNAEIFELCTMWFEAEDASFGDGYGRMMPFFYICLIAIGEEEKAQEAYGLRGMEAVQHFQMCLKEHKQDVIDAIEKL